MRKSRMRNPHDNLFDYTPVLDIQRPAHGGFLQIKKGLGYVKEDAGDTALQAKRIFNEIKKAVEANPNIRIRLIYSANNDQALLIHHENMPNHETWSTDAISSGLAGATGQGKLFRYLARHIEAAVQNGELNKDHVQILPFATSMHGSDDPHFIKVKKDNKLFKQYKEKGNIVTNTEQERDLLVCEMAVQAGCSVFAIAGPDNTYSIGGGQSGWFNTTDLVAYGGCSQGHYVQEQLKRIARYEPVMTVEQFKEAMLENLVENEFTFVEQKTYEKSHKSIVPEVRATNMQSYRPGVLLTSAEAREDYTQVTSAQLPCLLTIPADDRYEAIRILSWNIMENGVSDGFVVANKLDTLQEDSHGQDARHRQLTLTLADAVVKNRPHCITLQGVTHRKDIDSLAQDICNGLSAEWEIADSNEVIMGTVTLFNNKLFKQEKLACNDFKIKGNLVTFQSLLNPKNSFVISNIYPDAQAPNKLFDNIHEVINLDKAHKHIVVGDFNMYLPPVHTKKLNIITGTVRSVDAQKNQFQGATASVGALYGLLVDNAMHMCLADIAYLNPNNGEILTEQQCAPLDTSTLSKQQAYEILQFRPVLTPDARLMKKEWMPGKTRETIYREISPIAQSYYQGTALLASGGDIFITEARNLQNEVVLAVMFPRITLKNREKNPGMESKIRHKHQLFLKIFESPEMSYFSSQSTKNMDMICIPQENLGVLFDLLKDLQKREALIKAIQQEFFTYNNAGFFTGSRTVDKTQTGLDEQCIIEQVNKGAFLLALQAIQAIKQRYLGKKTTHALGSYGQRLNNIQSALFANYPQWKDIAVTSFEYWAISPLVTAKFLPHVQLLLTNHGDNFYDALLYNLLQHEKLPFTNHDLMSTEVSISCQLIMRLIEYKSKDKVLPSVYEISRMLLWLRTDYIKNRPILNSSLLNSLIVQLERYRKALCPNPDGISELVHNLVNYLDINQVLVTNFVPSIKNLLIQLDESMNKQDPMTSIGLIEGFVSELQAHENDQKFFDVIAKSLNIFKMQSVVYPVLTKLNGVLKGSKHSESLVKVFSDYAIKNPELVTKYALKTQAVLSEANSQLEKLDLYGTDMQAVSNFQETGNAYIQELLGMIALTKNLQEDQQFLMDLKTGIADFTFSTLEDYWAEVNKQFNHALHQ